MLVPVLVLNLLLGASSSDDANDRSPPSVRHAEIDPRAEARSTSPNFWPLRRPRERSGMFCCLVLGGTGVGAVVGTAVACAIASAVVSAMDDPPEGDQGIGLIAVPFVGAQFGGCAGAAGGLGLHSLIKRSAAPDEEALDDSASDGVGNDQPMAW